MTLVVSLPTRNQAQEELRAWSEVPDDLIDVGAAALAFAALRLPQRDVSIYRDHLDRLSAEVADFARNLRPQRVEQVAQCLREIIAIRHRYEGDEASYDSPDNANLIKVMERRRGLPVALGVLYIAAARANGWNAVGLSFPEHFLVRIEFNGRRVIIDPFDRGEIVAVPRMREILKQKMGPQAELRPDYTLPVSNRDVLLRLQNNLKLRFTRAGMDESAADILESMLLLVPDHAPLWREFGLTLTRLGDEHRALIALENYLTLSSDEPARHQTAQLVEQLRALTASAGA